MQGAVATARWSSDPGVCGEGCVGVLVHVGCSCNPGVVARGGSGCRGSSCSRCREPIPSCSTRQWHAIQVSLGTQGAGCQVGWHREAAVLPCLVPSGGQGPCHHLYCQLLDIRGLALGAPGTCCPLGEQDPAPSLPWSADVQAPAQEEVAPCSGNRAMGVVAHVGCMQALFLRHSRVPGKASCRGQDVQPGSSCLGWGPAAWALRHAWVARQASLPSPCLIAARLG
jgi:hypothetical protein